MVNETVLRKLKLQVQMSVDGYIARPCDEMNWLVWDDKYKRYVNELTEVLYSIFWDEKCSMVLFLIGQML